MLAIWIATAFVLGLLARQLRLPPLVGFLAAGFLLNAFGVERTPLLDEMYAMLYQDKPAKVAMRDLLSRDPRPETD